MSFKPLAAGITLLGLILVIPVAYLTQLPVTVDQVPILLTLVALYAFTEFFPLQRSTFSISLSLSVELLIFCKFGLVPAVIISQLLVFLGRWRRVGQVEFWPSLANAGMYLLTLTGSAAIAHALGGIAKGSVIHSLGPVIAYVIAHILINHLSVFVLLRTMHKIKLRTYLPTIRLDVFSTLFAASLGFILMLLYEFDHKVGLFAFGVPMILCVYVFKLFNDLWRSSALFRKLAELTGQFTAELELEAMSTRVTGELPKWFDQAHAIILVQRGNHLQAISFTPGYVSNATSAVCDYIDRNRSELRDVSLLTKRLVEEEGFQQLPYRTMMTAPLHSEQMEVGYICLLSPKYTDFDATTLDCVSILANQLSVSFRQAMRFEDVEKQSLYDPLTELPNQRFFERRLSEELTRLDGDVPVSLLLLDLDHFKKVNDTYGHQAGNVVLCKVARAFEANLRRSDFVARYGGEEFVIVLPGASSGQAADLAEKIRTCIETLPLEVAAMDGTLVTLQQTVSIGVATCPTDAKDAAQLIRYADRAMYIGAKRAGRNRVAVYSHESLDQ